MLSVYNEEGIKRFYDSIATICIRDLGFNEVSFNGYTHSYELADKVLDDIFEDKQANEYKWHSWNKKDKVWNREKPTMVE